MAVSNTERLVADHIDAIAEALRNLQRPLSAFAKELAQAASPAVVFEPIVDTGARSDDVVTGYRELSAGLSRRRAIEAFLQIEYGMADEVNQSIKCQGALGVRKRLISDALIINRAKSELKDALRAVAGKRVRVAVKDRRGYRGVEMKELSNVVLRRIQSSSINLLAAYRDIPLLEETPYSIRMMLTRTRSVPRKTAAALLALLAGRDDALAAADRERLQALDPKEYLVSPKERYPRMRAHVFYRRLDESGQAVRQIVMAELPILYPIRRGTRPPDVSKPAVRQNSRKHPVSYIESEEYVKTLHFRRVKAGHRKLASRSRKAKR